MKLTEGKFPLLNFYLLRFQFQVVYFLMAILLNQTGSPMNCLSWRSGG